MSERAPQPKPQPEDLFEEARANPSEWLPTVYVVHSRGGMTGSSLPSVPFDRSTQWVDVCRAIADRMEAPGPVMVRFCKPNRPMADRWSQWSADLEIGGAYFRPVAVAAAPTPQPQSQAQAPTITVPGDPLAAMRALVQDSEERAQKTVTLVLDAIKNERAAAAAAVSGPAMEAKTAMELGRLQAEVAHLRQLPAAQPPEPGAVATLIGAIATPQGGAIADRIMRVVERFARAAEIEAEARSTAADAELAKAAAAAGLEVGEGEPAAVVAPPEVVQQ